MIPRHEQVLRALDECTKPYGEYCAGFRMLSAQAEIKDPREVRRVVRHLARKGYAEFHKGLITDDGTFAGAGYCITVSGKSALGMLK